MDDGANPATSLQDAKALVEQDHVIAIVGEQSLADASWAAYIATKGIPVVGGITPEATFLTNPDFFASGANEVVATVGNVALAKSAGKTHFGVMYCAESPVCAQVVPLVQGAAALYGLKASAEKVAGTAPSYAAPCLAFKSAGVDALFVADNAAVVQRIVDACAQQGYKPAIISQPTTSSNAWLGDPNFDGALLSGINANPVDGSLPAVQQFQGAIDKYAPGLRKSSQFTFAAITTWAGAELFKAAAQAAKLTPSSTGADVKKGLYALKNETLGGLSGPLNFTPGKPAFVPCYFTEKLQGGKFASLNSNKPTCLTPTQAAGLIKALHLG
jgi:branched-chain amino acid transport system substrate-binding protein